MAFFAGFKGLLPQSLKNTFYHLPKALVALLLNGNPSRKLKIIAVTGSDGKTTTVHMIHHILSRSNLKTAMISSVKAQIGDEEIDTGFHVTSPDPLMLQKLLRSIAEKKFTHVVLEATSHGLSQHRFLGVNPNVAVHTNITHEHIDYHKTYANYVASKAKLFRTSEAAVLNKDDKSYPLLKAFVPRSTKIITYGLNSNSVVKAKNITTQRDSSSFTVRWGESTSIVSLPIPGRYNIQNALAAICAAGILGIKLKHSAPLLSSFKPVLGRLNLVHNHPKIYVDFAHTPNSLESVLRLLKRNLPKDGKLICVFGCAGERDVLKRPIMAAISTRLAEVSIFTAEDPRRESVDKIIAQMVQGVKKSRAKELNYPTELSMPHPVFVREPDRQKAINLAVKLAKKDDTIVVAGKGHEISMNFGSGELPWSDFEAVKRALSNEKTKS